MTLFDDRVDHAGSTPPAQPPRWIAFAALAVTTLGLGIGVAEQVRVIHPSAGLSACCWVAVVVAGSSLLAVYKWRSGRASRALDYIERTSMARLCSVLPVLIVAACAVHGFIVSTAWSKR